MQTSMLSMFNNSLEVYEYLCKPICESAGILQGELNVLLFLANHPGKDTAMDIHKNAGMKQSMISTLVEKLVQSGYLIREAIPGDRRRVKLVYTEKAEPLIHSGQGVQKRLRKLISEGVSAEDMKACARVMAIAEKNVYECREKMLKGELK